MKQLWLHSVRAYIRLGLFFYFKKIKVVNAEHVPKKGTVLFLANHQNALLDALLIATNSGRFSYFLTRASVFQNVIISRILKSLMMLPVYRLRDGWNNLSKNNAIFKRSSKLLSEANAIVIFPEGSHNLKRTVRPLSKGFTRIISETFERYPKTHMQLLPVGLNFVHAETFGDSASVYFGNPMPITLEDTPDNNESVPHLKEMVHSVLCKLTTHIPLENYDATLNTLNNLNVDFLDPKAVNDCMATNFKNCEPSRSKGLPVLKVFFKCCLILTLLVPYLIWKLAIQPKIKEVEFTSTFRFAVSITLVPMYLLVLFFLMSFKLALVYLLGVLVLALLAVKL
ncbi:MAG TPA: 1-acyl-sn-glycerol-3-phosphate acyltransferase [Flavobacteriaceae bacterium]|nr:1-acyl-sn-glycerol-3-phosphate acyltransferase [Flavobacteriaceae bacterium]